MNKDSGWYRAALHGSTVRQTHGEEPVRSEGVSNHVVRRVNTDDINRTAMEQVRP